MKMKEGRLEDPWKCVMNDCSNILCFPENSSRLINSWEEQRASLRFLTLSIPSSLDRLLSARNSAPFFLLFLWIKKERESEMAFCFIFLFYYFHFLVFICFFLGGRRFITTEESNNKTQTQKVEDDLSLPSAPLSSSLSLSRGSVEKRKRRK